MRNLQVFLFLLLIFFGFNSCEKDDICVEGDTPLLIIRFFDAQNPTALKSVTGLRVRGDGQDNPVDTFTDRGTLDSIAIPLRINQPGTLFEFISDSADEDEMEIGNIDRLNFTYTTDEVFVSRACGFIANYSEMETELTTDAENWIQAVLVVNPDVKLTDSAHVIIFH